MASSKIPDLSAPQQLSQARYERSLLHEITKLQAALAEERTTMAAQKHQMETETAAAHNKKVSESEKASRLAAMEKAIEGAQKSEQKAFMKKVINVSRTAEQKL